MLINSKECIVLGNIISEALEYAGWEVVKCSVTARTKRDSYYGVYMHSVHYDIAIKWVGRQAQADDKSTLERIRSALDIVMYDERCEAGKTSS